MHSHFVSICYPTICLVAYSPQLWAYFFLGLKKWYFKWFWPFAPTSFRFLVLNCQLYCFSIRSEPHLGKNHYSLTLCYLLAPCLFGYSEYWEHVLSISVACAGKLARVLNYEDICFLGTRISTLNDFSPLLLQVGVLGFWVFKYIAVLKNTTYSPFAASTPSIWLLIISRTG